MPTITKQFDTYSVVHFSNFNHSAPFGTLYEAVVHCYMAGVSVARMGFVKDGSPIPVNTVNDNLVCLNFSISRFSEVMATLRQEKPLQVNLDLDNQIGYFSTGSLEPVGEEESKSPTLES